MRLSFLLIFLSSLSSAQNWQACDSLDISCCQYNVFGPNTITITVTNNSSVLFDYPSFVLFNSNMDTVAIETVNYFGIGSNPQSHTMNIVAPLNLPMTGYLNLYSLFFDTLACSFPFTVPDTVIGIADVQHAGYALKAYPNPVAENGEIEIQLNGLSPGSVELKITDTTGRISGDTSITIDANGNGKAMVNLHSQGCYFITVRQDRIFLSEILIR